jgi:hypothetical protein
MESATATPSSLPWYIYKLEKYTLKFSTDSADRFNVNHACPVCRDEYLFFDYRVSFMFIFTL